MSSDAISEQDIEMAANTGQSDLPDGVIHATDHSREAQARRVSALSLTDQVQEVVQEIANNGIIPNKDKQRQERRESMKQRRKRARSLRPTSEGNATVEDIVVGDEEIEEVNKGEDTELTWKEELCKAFMSRPFLYSLMWVVWLITGTVYYSLRLRLTVSKGFYQSVNVGYSVGWGDIAENASETQLFSTIYVCIGASFVGAGLGFFAESVVADVDNWYINAQQEALYDLRQERTTSWIMKAVYWFAFHWEKVRAILLWLAFIIVGTAVACDINGWSFATGLYFSTSSLSTGGLVALPPDSSDWAYGLLGLYGAVGIPLMALAMGTLAGFFLNVGDIEDTYNDMKQPVTDEELGILRDLDLVDDDGQLDRLEFVILCMMRMGTDPALIFGIKEYFDEVDVDGSGALSVAELHAAALRKNKSNSLKDLKKIHALGVKVDNFHHPIVNWFQDTFGEREKHFDGGGEALPEEES
jgi:hypothetical protein